MGGLFAELGALQAVRKRAYATPAAQGAAISAKVLLLPWILMSAGTWTWTWTPESRTTRPASSGCLAKGSRAWTVDYEQRPTKVSLRGKMKSRCRCMCRRRCRFGFLNFVRPRPCTGEFDGPTSPKGLNTVTSKVRGPTVSYQGSLTASIGSCSLPKILIFNTYMSTLLHRSRFDMKFCLLPARHAICWLHISPLPSLPSRYPGSCRLRHRNTAEPLRPIDRQRAHPAGRDLARISLDVIADHVADPIHDVYSNHT